MVLGQKIVLSLFLSIFSFPHTDTLSLSLSPFTISFLFSPSSSTSFLISVLRYALMPVSLPFLPSLLSIFSLFSPSFFPPFSIQFLSSYQIDLEKGKYTVCLSSNLSFSHSLTLSVYTRASHPLPPPYLLNIPSARDSKCGLFFFFSQEKRIRKVAVIAKENSTRGGGSSILEEPCITIPLPPNVFSLKPVMRRTPSLPFLFSFLS